VIKHNNPGGGREYYEGKRARRYLMVVETQGGSERGLGGAVTTRTRKRSWLDWTWDNCLSEKTDGSFSGDKRKVPVQYGKKEGGDER